MAIRVPDPHKQPLVKLSQLPEEHVRELSERLRATTPAISPRALAEQLAPSSAIPVRELTAILTVLLSLTIARQENRRSADEIARDVAEAAASEGFGELRLDESDAQMLRTRLVRLLTENPTLEVTVRAARVYFAHERLYRTSRILSDIRPIFGAGDSLSPAVGMIVHNLEVEITRNEESEAWYVAMNVHDLLQLRSVIDRAIEKDSLLRSTISTAGLTYIEDLPNNAQRNI